MFLNFKKQRISESPVEVTLCLRHLGLKEKCLFVKVSPLLYQEERMALSLENLIKAEENDLNLYNNLTLFNVLFLITSHN